MNAFKVGIRGKQLALPVAAAALLSAGGFTAWHVTRVLDPVLLHSDDFHLTLRFTPHAS